MSFLALVYSAMFVYVGGVLFSMDRRVPAALFYMMAIFCAPLFIYGIQITAYVFFSRVLPPATAC
jgi:hypothetical protein